MITGTDVKVKELEFYSRFLNISPKIEIFQAIS